MAQRWGFKRRAGLVILGLGVASCATVVVTDKDDPTGDDGSGGASMTDASSATASASGATASSSSSSSSGGVTSEGEAFFETTVYPTLVGAGCTACHGAPGVANAPVFLTKDASGSYELIKTKPSIYAPPSKSSIFTIGTAGNPHTGGPISENLKSAFKQWLALEFPM